MKFNKKQKYFNKDFGQYYLDILQAIGHRYSLSLRTLSSKLIFALFSPRKFIRKYRNLKLYKRIQELKVFKMQNSTFPNYENELKKSYSTLINKGDTVIDVGAHAGLHLNKFIELVGENGFVLGFEPLPQQFEVLQGAYSSFKNVTLVNKALSNETGEVDFFAVEGSPEESGLKQRKNYNNPLNARPQKITVSMGKLDNYEDKLKRIDFMKLDTEGSELKILEGAKNLLKKYRPLISIEYGHDGYSAYGFTSLSLFQFANENKYVLSDLWGNIIPSMRVWKDVCDTIYWDFFLIPKEKLTFFSKRMNDNRENSKMTTLGDNSQSA